MKLYALTVDEWLILATLGFESMSDEGLSLCKLACIYGAFSMSRSIGESAATALTVGVSLFCDGLVRPFRIVSSRAQQHHYKGTKKGK